MLRIIGCCVLLLLVLAAPGWAEEAAPADISVFASYYLPGDLALNKAVPLRTASYQGAMQITVQNNAAAKITATWKYLIITDQQGHDKGCLPVDPKRLAQIPTDTAIPWLRPNTDNILTKITIDAKQTSTMVFNPADFGYAVQPGELYFLHMQWVVERDGITTTSSHTFPYIIPSSPVEYDSSPFSTSMLYARLRVRIEPNYPAKRREAHMFVELENASGQAVKLTNRPCPDVSICYADRTGIIDSCGDMEQKPPTPLTLLPGETVRFPVGNGTCPMVYNPDLKLWSWFDHPTLMLKPGRYKCEGTMYGTLEDGTKLLWYFTNFDIILPGDDNNIPLEGNPIEVPDQPTVARTLVD